MEATRLSSSKTFEFALFLEIGCHFQTVQKLPHHFCITEQDFKTPRFVLVCQISVHRTVCKLKGDFLNTRPDQRIVGEVMVDKGSKFSKGTG